jgi:CrcB protein
VKKLGLIAAAGAVLGSTLRYLVGLTLTSADFPWATLTVNVVGSFLIGLFLGLPAITNHDERRVFLITGVLGGFTTFSAVAVETLQLSAQLALVYVFSSFIAGTLAASVAFKVASKP